MRDPDAYLVARLRFRHLALVESLGTLRSIRKTARALNFSEPAVSKALAEIETSFGFPLFERSPAGVTPTSQGEAVVNGARLLLNSLRHVRLTAANAERRLVIRLGIAPFLALTALPAIVKAIHRKSTDVELELREGPGPQLLQLLQDGNIDAMLMTMSAGEFDGHAISGITYHELSKEALTVIAPADHPLTRRRSLGWRDLIEEKWILPRPSSVVATSVRNACLAQGAAVPRASIVSTSPMTNLALVSAGLGVSVVPAPLVRIVRDAVAILRVSPLAYLPPVSVAFHTAAADTPELILLKQALTLPP